MPKTCSIDASFFLSKSHFAESGCGLEPTHLYNGRPTAFTDLRAENLQLDPHRAATLRRSTFLPYDGVLYEINDAPTEDEAVWSYNGRHHLTYAEYQRMQRDEQEIRAPQPPPPVALPEHLRRPALPGEVKEEVPEGLECCICMEPVHESVYQRIQGPPSRDA